MARCGCGGECACNLVAGDNTTVTGTGSATLPWQVHTATNCDEVRTCIAGGDGITYDPADGIVHVCIDPSPDNQLQAGANGCLLVPPAAIDCEQVRTCISADNGAEYDAATGVVSVCVSPDEGNQLTQDANGCLLVPASAGGNVVAGCGLSGNGTAAAPLVANVPAWPFDCPPEENGSAISCGTDGVLRGEPPYHSYFFQSIQEELFPDNPEVPTPDDTIVHTFSFDVTNPDPCREMRILSFRDVDVDFNMPSNSRAAMGISTDEMWNHRNTGSVTSFDEHVQLAKLTSSDTPLAPGETRTLTLEVSMAKGDGGATYNRIQGSFRTTLVPF